MQKKVSQRRLSINQPIQNNKRKIIPPAHQSQCSRRKIRCLSSTKGDLGLAEAKTKDGGRKRLQPYLFQWMNTLLLKETLDCTKNLQFPQIDSSSRFESQSVQLPAASRPKAIIEILPIKRIPRMPLVQIPWILVPFLTRLCHHFLHPLLHCFVKHHQALKILRYFISIFFCWDRHDPNIHKIQYIYWLLNNREGSIPLNPNNSYYLHHISTFQYFIVHSIDWLMQYSILNILLRIAFLIFLRQPVLRGGDQAGLPVPQTSGRLQQTHDTYRLITLDLLYFYSVPSVYATKQLTIDSKHLNMLYIVPLLAMSQRNCPLYLIVHSTVGL